MFRQSSHKRNFFKALTVSAAKESPKLRRAFKSCLTILLESVPFLIACAVLVSVISLKSPILLFCLLVGSLIALITQQIGQQVNLPRRSLILLQILAAAIVLSLYWLDWFAAPAQAQFFGKAETFFKESFRGSITNGNDPNFAISLIFNVLRAIYLLYIAISLVGVINAVRKDEDWQSIARTPLLVVVAVTIADVLTGFVIGTGPNK
ncbi:MAG: hypothetical protein RM368_15965 [Nostoc sp. DedSLP03]|uniref:hypothetical protein n=1 Tax=Nostoc sp. DedSLP03 TaxID=3075400 RepID=UPI002AD451B0|nr:hypothetical protein [Nostoc sp. DedSLP03]MDZ7966447.1 hypothetical protein [Nostoc sp. DedSLP03]